MNIDITSIMSQIMEVSPVGIAIYDETGQCIFANKATADIIGATKDQLIKQNYNNIESWKKSGIDKLAKNALTNNTTTRDEFTIVSTFGKEVSLDINFTPIENNNQTNL
ncbi:MAG: PAS domain S-box protein, partial [Gammaproteobacteria bacterium]|nr:PAS domain S-box protein [Gammaproteobacteria bacterium]